MVHLKVAPPLSPIRSSTAPPLAGGIASIPSIRKEHPHERVHFSHDLARQREQWELLWRTSGILRTTLADAGQDGWGAAVTASSTAFAGLFLLLLTVGVSLAYSIAGSESHALTAGLNDFAWAGVVLTSFPRAMLIMAGSFGLWRARLIPNALFAAGVAALLLVLLGGTTWLRGGFWAPDGAYSRFVSPLIGLVWIVVVSRVLLKRSPPTRVGW
jgi:hypothetical protein